jgi:hypothetical protein
METIYHNRGDTFSALIQCQKHDGTPLDITGYKFFATFKKKSDTDAADAQAVFKKDWDVHVDAVNGKTLFTATSTEMNIDEGLYLGDVQSVVPGLAPGDPSTVDTPAIFNIIIEPTATNRTT